MSADLIDPDMPAQQLRMHMGEMTSQEMRTARAAIRWANTRLRTALEAEASEGERLRAALRSTLALVDDYLAYHHDGDPWAEDARFMGEMEMNYADEDGRLAAIRSLVSEGAALILETPARTNPENDPRYPVLLADAEAGGRNENLDGSPRRHAVASPPQDREEQ